MDMLPGVLSQFPNFDIFSKTTEPISIWYKSESGFGCVLLKDNSPFKVEHIIKHQIYMYNGAIKPNLTKWEQSRSK